MAAITITRELGSDGDYIARQTAHILGFHLADKSIIERILSQYGLIQFGEEYETAGNFWEQSNSQKEQTVQMLNQILLAMAHLGNVVILGRGGFAVLNLYADVLNVRIQAPFSVRVRRIMQRQNISKWEQAQLVVKESDQIRSSFILDWHGAHWDSADAYNLVIDTCKIPRDLASAWLIQAYRTMVETPSSYLPSTKDIQVDPILVETVNVALARELVE